MFSDSPEQRINELERMIDRLRVEIDSLRGALKSENKAIRGGLDAHDHDKRYARLAHSHPLKRHNHDSRYAKSAHDHDSRYARARHKHSHDEIALPPHDSEHDDHNDERYAAVDHNHDGEYLRALPVHDHGDDYAAVDHEHELTPHEHPLPEHTHPLPEHSHPLEEHTHPLPEHDHDSEYLRSLPKHAKEHLTGNDAIPLANEKHKGLMGERHVKELHRLKKAVQGVNAQVGAIAAGGIPELEEHLRNHPDGGHIIQDEGADLTQRKTLNFVGSGVDVTDDPATETTRVSIFNLNRITISDSEPQNPQMFDVWIDTSGGATPDSLDFSTSVNSQYLTLLYP